MVHALTAVVTFYKRDRAEEILLARYSDIKGLPYQAPSAPTANGSVFSNNEIFAATNRLSTLQVAKSALWKEPLKVQYARASASSPAFSTDFPHRTGPGTAASSLSTTPESGASPSFLSR